MWLEWRIQEEYTEFLPETSWRVITLDTKKDMDVIIKMLLRDTACENERWTELFKGRLQWRVFVLEVLIH